MKDCGAGAGLLACILIAASGVGTAAAAASATPENPGVMSAVLKSRDGAVELLKSLVNIDSGTGDEAGGRKILNILEARLGTLGAEVKEAPAEAPGLPPALVAVFKGTGKGKLLLIGHLDTVFPPGTAQKRPFSIEGGRAHGPGVGDEKAGVAAAVTALEILKSIGWRDFGSVTLLIDNSEERGSPGAAALIKRLAAESDVELNLEPGDPPDAATVWRKGSASIRIHVKGRAAHAGIAPQDGRNAAVELVHQLDAVKGRFPTSGPGVTVNLTLLKAGERANIIPDDAEATLNVRYRAAAAFDDILKVVQEDALVTVVPDTEVSVAYDPAFPPLVENEATLALAARAQRIYRELGRELQLSGNGGASESALAQSVGTPALDGLGFVGGDFHTDHEWVDLSSVTPRLYLLTRLMMDLGAHPPQKVAP